jgi:hypothetical protein
MERRWVGETRSRECRALRGILGDGEQLRATNSPTPLFVSWAASLSLESYLRTMRPAAAPLRATSPCHLAMGAEFIRSHTID